MLQPLPLNSSKLMLFICCLTAGYTHAPSSALLWICVQCSKSLCSPRSFQCHTMALPIQRPTQVWTKLSICVCLCVCAHVWVWQPVGYFSSGTENVSGVPSCPHSHNASLPHKGSISLCRVSQESSSC